jgi:hypothetical protein
MGLAVVWGRGAKILRCQARLMGRTTIFSSLFGVRRFVVNERERLTWIWARFQDGSWIGAVQESLCLGLVNEKVLGVAT